MSSCGLLFVLVSLVVFGANVCVSAQQTSCTTPNGEAATCIRIKQCTVIRNVLVSADDDMKNFIRASQCPGFQGREPYVCCGTVAGYQAIGGNIPNRNADLLPSECGRQISDRILRGESTNLGEFPWMVLLEYKRRNGNGYTFACGGTIISERYVLTAAHCVTGPIIQRVGELASLRLGEWNINTAEDCFEFKGYRECSDPPISVPFEQIVAHKGYKDTKETKQHDIALIRLKDSIHFTDYIRPVCLSRGNIQPGDQLYVSGWGRTESSSYSSTKQKLLITVTTEAQCSSKFGTAGIQIFNTQVCAGGEAGKDSCQGDSGGPLMKQHLGGQWTIDGIVSFGGKCGTAGLPGVYTRVESYSDWIHSNIRP